MMHRALTLNVCSFFLTFWFLAMYFFFLLFSFSPAATTLLFRTQALYENEWDTITITLNLMEEHANHPAKLELLQRFNVSTKRSFRLRHGRLNQDFMSMCRLSAMTEYDMKDRRNDLRFWSEGVSIENECGAQRVYAAMLETRLNAYPTTFQDDQVILNNEPDDQRLVAATRYRHCKKRILHNHLDLLNRALQPIMAVLKVQEDSKLLPNDPKGLQVNYLQKYLETILNISKRGPVDIKGRITVEDLRRQKEEEENRAREVMMMEQDANSLQTTLRGNGGGSCTSTGGVEHKSEVIVTHPNGSSKNELMRLKTELRQALAEGRTVKSGVRDV